jgi:hypothetical protein
MSRFRVTNSILLATCVAMYFGTGWSLILFSFPIRPQLTVNNYYLQFVPQVTAATHFFTWMTAVMLISGVAMIITEFRSPLRWAPIIVVAGILASTVLTVVKILPLNSKMSAGITDPRELDAILDAWIRLNRIRVSFWTIQWIALMVFFGFKLRKSKDYPITQ